MAYEKQNFENGAVLYAAQLDYMEDGIVNAQEEAESLASAHLTISDITAPKDNDNGTLEADGIGAEIVNENAVFTFDTASYESTYEDTWDSLNFSFQIALSTLKALDSLKNLYLVLWPEDPTGSGAYSGESLPVCFFLNYLNNWNSSTRCNEAVTAPAYLDRKTLYHLDADMLQAVIDNGGPLYVVVDATGRNDDTAPLLTSDMVSELGGLKLTMAIADRSGVSEPAAFVRESDYAALAEYAETAAYAAEAASADTAAYADATGTVKEAGKADWALNFFPVVSSDLLNEDGVLWAEGADSEERPDLADRSYSVATQYVVAYDYGEVGTGYAKRCEIYLTVGSSSSSTSGQCYIKNISGMLNFEDALEKLQEGYSTFYLCEVESGTDGPDGSTAGNRTQRFMIQIRSSGTEIYAAYLDVEAEVQISDEITLRVWSWTPDMDELQDVIDADSISADRWGVWHARNYSGDDTEWHITWYWQDYAFTDGSQTADEMAEYFFKRWAYLASDSSHGRLSEAEENIAELQEIVEGLDSAYLASAHLAVDSVTAPQDNDNGTLEADGIGAEIVNDNAVFTFDTASYESTYEDTWSSVNFSFEIALSTLTALDSLENLYLVLWPEDPTGSGAYSGESLPVCFFLNYLNNWSSSTRCNEAVTAPAYLDRKTLYHLDADMLQAVIDNGGPLYVVVDATGRNDDTAPLLTSDMVSELGGLKLTMAIADRSGVSEPAAFVRESDYAAYAETAASAVTATSADTAAYADVTGTVEEAEKADWALNFFPVVSSDLLNEDGVLWAEGADSEERPDLTDRSYSVATQYVVAYDYGEVGTGYAKRCEIYLTVGSSSSSTSGQCYVKNIAGMLDFEDALEKLQEGYSTFYLCEVESGTDGPDGSTAGNRTQRFMIQIRSSGTEIYTAYLDVEAELQISDEITLRVWSWTPDMDELQDVIDADSISADRWGVWHARNYSGDDTEWHITWYWQDYAFTDGSQTADGMAEYFFKRWAYLASDSSHGRLTEAEEDIAELQETVAELTGAQTNIVCWGDSLTAMGGWTETLEELTGLTVYNAGTGGEEAQTIMARQGGDCMQICGITIPAGCEAVTLATYADDGGIPTALGRTAKPLLQGGTAHVNPVMIGDVEGTLAWTGETYSDTTGTWTFTRSEAGDEVEVNRDTAIRTYYDRTYNGSTAIMIIFMGQNGGWDDDVDTLVNMHRLMIDHFQGKEYLIPGLHTGTASERADYEAAMTEAFGRRFVSLRQYLAHPVYDTDGETIVSSWGLDDAGLTATDDDLTAIAQGECPPQLLSDTVHFTEETMEVVGQLLYRKMQELGMV